jgi:hypothetical protein
MMKGSNFERRERIWPHENPEVRNPVQIFDGRSLYLTL